MQPAQSLRQHQEMELAIAANAANAAPRPSIFKLDVDCFDEIFDYISLKDLCAIGLTCKHLQRLAGTYFAQNYPDQSIGFNREQNGKIIQTISGCETNFAPFARCLCLIISGGIDILRYAAAQKYPSLKKIKLVDRDNFPMDHLAFIIQMKIWAQVTTIEIRVCTPNFMDSFLDGILLVDLCPNLSNLILNSIVWNSNLDSEWLHKNIPTLQRFETNSFIEDEFENFLRANRQIKKLSYWVDGSLQIIERIGLELDELEYISHWAFDIDKEICDEINALHAKGHIKDVQVRFDVNYCDDNLHNLKDVSCITSARIEWAEEPEFISRFALLVHLQKLHMDWKITLNDAELLSKSLVNLQELHLLQNSLFAALPFARRLPKLRIIKAWRESESIVDIVALNKERTKLPNAEVLQIYLADAAYRQICWTSVDLLLDMVKIRRLILTRGDDL